MAILFITHDLNIVRRFAGPGLRHERRLIVEQGRWTGFSTGPEHPYTRRLLAAEPGGRPRPVPADAAELLVARNLRVDYALDKGWFGRRRAISAVRGIDVTIRSGQTVGVVGESGSGKSTLGLAVLRLLHPQGTLRFDGRDIHDATARALKPLRRDMQIVFQDPYGSLSPRLSVAQIVAEGLLVHEPGLDQGARRRRVAEVLTEVGLEPAAMDRYPHEFSGGQRQRIAIARAMVLRPRLVVLDEPTSALDVSVQAQIVDLLRDLQARHQLAYLFVSHDLRVVRALADHLLVMKDGAVVEQGPAAAVFESPQTDYTRALLAAAFDLGKRRIDAGPDGLSAPD